MLPMEMNRIIQYLKQLNLPDKASHKGQNGRLMIIGGSKLFHAASLWSLKVASRIVDLVHFASVAENNRIVQKLKEEFRDGIVVSRSEVENYIEEDDCILIGPGMVRTDFRSKSRLSGIPQAAGNLEFRIKNVKEIDKIKDEGAQTYYLTKYLLRKYPDKKWVIDAGSLQMLDPEDIPVNAILTPHHQEFEKLVSSIKYQVLREKIQKSETTEQVKLFAKEFKCIVLLKGEIDLIASETEYMEVVGGNAGMTKGGTGDVLAGLVAALFCKNEATTSAVSASFINKKAGEELFKKNGYWYNASDLTDQIPETMKRLLF